MRDSSTEGNALSLRPVEGAHAGQQTGLPATELDQVAHYAELLLEQFRQTRRGKDSAEKEGVERDAVLFLRSVRRLVKELGDELLSIYRPMIRGLARRLAPSDASLREHLCGDLHVAFVRAVDGYDGQRPFAVYTAAWLRNEAKQSASRWHGYSDAMRRAFSAVWEADRRLEQHLHRRPLAEEIVADLAHSGRALSTDEVAALRHDRTTPLGHTDHRVADPLALADRLDRLDAARTTLRRAWTSARLGPVDVFLVVAKTVVDVEDADLAAWAAGADGGFLDAAIARTCDALDCTWLALLGRLGVPPTLQATPEAVRAALLRDGSATTAEALGRRRRRREAALQATRRPSTPV